MDKSDIIKESIKRILSMLVMILIFVIGILAVYFSSLLVGHQETLKTSSGEVISVDQKSTHESSGDRTTIVVEKDDNLRVKQITPLSGI